MRFHTATLLRRVSFLNNSYNFQYSSLQTSTNKGTKSHRKAAPYSDSSFIICMWRFQTNVPLLGRMPNTVLGLIEIQFLQQLYQKFNKAKFCKSSYGSRTIIDSPIDGLKCTLIFANLIRSSLKTYIYSYFIYETCN